MSAEPTARSAARVLLVDPRGRVLMVRLEFEGRSWWIAPGGGVDSGETPEQAAVREVREETGLEDFELGPWVWWREHVFPWDGHVYRQRERFYLARVAGFEQRHELLETERVVVAHHQPPAGGIEGRPVGLADDVGEGESLFVPRRAGRDGDER